MSKFMEWQAKRQIKRELKQKTIEQLEHIIAVKDAQIEILKKQIKELKREKAVDIILEGKNEQS